MRRRLLFALAGLVASLVVSGLAWLQFGQPVLFLVVPLVPFLFWRRGGSRPPERRCSECGFSTRDPSVAYCPRDGTELERDADRTPS